MFLKQLSMAAPSDERTLRSSSFLTPSFDPTPEDMTYYEYATYSCIINDKLSYNNHVQTNYTLLSLLSHLILLAIILYPFPLFFLIVHQSWRYLISPAHPVLSNFFKPDKDLV